MSKLKLIIDNDESDDDSSQINTENVDNSIQNKNGLPWIEKYRPHNLSDVVEHAHIIEALQEYIKNKFLPHLLFYGPPGTGKTSTILACVNELYGKNAKYMVLELNASDERGIDVVRNRIKTFITKKSLSFDNSMENLFKLVILDEIDAMTQDAQAILKKLVEMHTLNVRFCLICNFIQKIDLALQSRCTIFRFAPLAKKNIIPRINKIIEIEKLNITDKAVDIIIRRSGGDMRKILNQLQAMGIAYDEINENNLNKFFGYPTDETINEIINIVSKHTLVEAYKLITNIKYIQGISIIDIITEIYILLEAMIITKKSSNNIIKKLRLEQIVNLITLLKQIELNQNISTNENIQTASLIASFKLALSDQQLEEKK